MLALAALVTVAGAAAVWGEQKPSPSAVTAGLFPFPPLYVLRPNERPSGYAIELFDAVAREAGLAVAYRSFDTFLETLAALEAGEVDLIPNVGMLASRQGDLDFSVPVGAIPIKLFVRAGTSGIVRLGDLGQHPVAVVRTNVGVELAAAHPGIVSVVYPDLSSALAALISGHADALIYPAPMLWKIARELNLERLIKETGEPLREVKRAMAVRKGNAALLERLNPAIIRVIASPEFREVRERWYGEPPPFWTPALVAGLMGALLVAVAAALGGAYHVRVLRLNRRLLQSIAERRAAKEAVFLRDAQLREAQRLAQVGSWELDLQTNRLTWSDEICRIFEIDKATVGATYEAFLAAIHPEDRDAVNLAYQRSLQAREPYEIAHRLRMPDGRIKHVSQRCETDFGADGKPRRSRGTVQDITERLALEQQLRHAQKMEAVGVLAGGIAHEFNNLLQVIRGYTELALKRSRSEPQVAEDLERALSATHTASLLTSRLLNFSRKNVLSTERLNLNEVVVSVLGMVRSVIGAAVELDMQTDEREPQVRVDRVLFDQVIVNLCVNARDAMPDGGRLGIAVRSVEATREFRERHTWSQPGRYVAVSVTDSGSGMTPEVRARVFEPFFTTKEVGKGTGLGLSIAFGIVQQHNGYIEVESEPGRGSTLTVYLPEATEPAEAATALRERPVVPAIPVTASGSETVLVAEDDCAVRELLVQMLSGDGYRVLAVPDGVEAVQAFREHRADVQLLVLDLVMPRQGGWATYEQIRCLEPHIPVVFSSGYSRDASDPRMIGQSHIKVVQKPYSPEQLSHAVRTLLDHSKRPPALS